ncbi:MAG TPA: ubiquinone biosynthesis hydroxylase [Propylenella sp.]|nr:ubiquinone biosynthesis hydroxylase [Propylenella sp.]
MGDRADVLIAGGGTAGLVAALAIARSAPDIAVEIVDAKPATAASRDERASAIAAAARRMLGRLGIWSELADDAQPILAMEITDSRTGDVVRPVFLTFDGDVSDGEPFAHMVPNGRLAAILGDAARAAGIRITAPASVGSFEAVNGHVRVSLASGEERRAKILVAADGIRSRLRSHAGIRTITWTYPQTAIVANVRHERPHNGVAVEHFLPGGPFANLPLKGNRSSLVWTERSDDARKLMATDDFVFLIELERRFGHRLGQIELDGPRQSHPLGLILARDFVRPRFALLGDAAHGIHPIAGQGLNLGFRDAAALAETLVDAHRLGLDLGALDVLRRYERWRRYDTWQMGVTTDLLNRLFSNDFGPLRAIRDIGLGIVDRLPRLKTMFIGEAAGFGGELPKLLKGEAL